MSKLNLPDLKYDGPDFLNIYTKKVWFFLTTESLHMSHGHAKNGELVWLAGERGACGYHVAELGDIRSHLVASSSLDFAVVLPVERRRRPSISWRK